MTDLWSDANKETLAVYPDLVVLVGKQLNKDLQLEGYESILIVPTTLDDIYEKLYDLVSKMINSDFNGLMRLLYRIDISEKKVQRGMDLYPDDTPKAISTLMLKREIQKVILRKQYSS